MKILKITIQILIILVIVAVGVFFYQTCSGSKLIERIDKAEPDDAGAPFKVWTRTRTYLAGKAVQNDDGSVTMYNWYERDGKKWVYHEKAITIPPLLHPRISRR